MPRRQSAFSLIELLTVLAVLGILAAVTVPLAAGVHGRWAARDGAWRLAVALRRGQAVAEVHDHRTRVRLTDGGRCFVLEEFDGEGWAALGHEPLSSACTTNYPGGTVEFCPAGWPCASGSDVPRAGTFTLSAGTYRRFVVVQLGGRIRCR